MLVHSSWVLRVADPTTLSRDYGLEIVKHLHQQLGLEVGAEQMPSTYLGILGSVTVSGEVVTFILKSIINCRFVVCREVHQRRSHLSSHLVLMEL